MKFGQRKIAAAASAAIVLAAQASAEIPEGDILITTDGSTLVTGLVSEDGSTTTTGVRVFFAEVGLDVPNFAAEPGWQGPDGTFTPGTQIGFTVNRALRKWNGTDFGTAASETIELSFGSFAPVVTPATDLPVRGFDLTIDSAGGLHDHPDYLLTAGSGGSIGDGVYLLDLSFSTDQPGIGGSLPVWILFGQNASIAEGEAAYAYAAATIPAPGVAFTLGAGVAWAARRRRR